MSNNSIKKAPPPSSSSNEQYNKLMESLLRITLSGFGGALAGLSISKRRTSLHGYNATTTTTTNSLKRRRSSPYVDPDLPTTWAVSCVTFAGIVEFCRIMGPTGFLVDVVLPTVTTTTSSVEKKEEESLISNDKNEVIPPPPPPKNWKKTSMQSIGDYTLGGAIAGALFQGASVRTKTASRLSRAGITMSSSSSSVAARTGIVAGLIPGATLGCLAGVAIVGLDVLDDFARDALEEKEEEEEEEEEDVVTMKGNGDKGEEEEEIPEDIKHMSNEEIQKQIDLYRSRLEQQRNGSGGDDDDGKE